MCKPILVFSLSLSQAEQIVNFRYLETLDNHLNSLVMHNVKEQYLDSLFCISCVKILEKDAMKIQNPEMKQMLYSCFILNSYRTLSFTHCNLN